MKSSFKDFLEKILSLGVLLLGIYAIWSLLKDDSADIVSDKGRRVLESDEKMKRVNEEIKKLKSSSGGVSEQPSRIVVNFD